MKAFLHGRTEAIRTVQPESVKFVKVLDPSFPSVECGLIVDQTFCSETASPQDKVAALRTACKYHTQLTKECSQGFGQDRSVSRYHPILKFTDSHLGTFTPCTRLSNETYMLPSLNRSAMNRLTVKSLHPLYKLPMQRKNQKFRRFSQIQATTSLAPVYSRQVTVAILL